jgi:hypothetical protein
MPPVETAAHGRLPMQPLAGRRAALEILTGSAWLSLNDDSDRNVDVVL